MCRLLLLFLAVTLCSAPGARAQMQTLYRAQCWRNQTFTKPGVHAQLALPSKALDDMLNMFEAEFTSAAEAMPADKYGFTPANAAFVPAQHSEYTGVRTFAQEIAHVAEANYYFYSQISDIKPDIDPRSILRMKSKPELLHALAQSFAYGHRVIATITPENAFTTIKGVDGMNTRTTVAAFAVAHGFDHYGQIVEYLRMNGIIPPASRK